VLGGRETGNSLFWLDSGGDWISNGRGGWVVL